MEQHKNFGDFRQTLFCIYCGGATETKDHVPPRILLDEPHPENLHKVPACLICNNGFSFDEEYFACLIECAVCGETNPIRLEREKIRKTLAKQPLLLTRLEQARSINEGTIFL